MNKTRAALSGILPSQSRKPPKFAFAISLYRTNLLFRSLVDLALVGLVVVVFTSPWTGIFGSSGTSAASPDAGDVAAVTEPPNPAPATRAPLKFPDAAKGARSGPGWISSWVAGAGPGWATLADARPTRIAPSILATSGPAIRPTLENVDRRLAHGDIAAAKEQLSKLNSEDPIAAYVGAVVLMNEPDHSSIEVERLLRRATDHTVAPAFTLLGKLKFDLVYAAKTGQAPASELKMLDGAGNTTEASADELLDQAADWWRRASAFNEAEAKRYLGMMAARGFYGGKPDYASASAFWNEAAALGDGVSSAELGTLYLTGIGVQPDHERAIKLLRTASDQGFIPANLFLAVALAPKMKAGDHEAAMEVFGALKRAIDSDLPDDARGYAYHLRGLFLMETAPADMRDPPNAIQDWRSAVILGDRASIFSLGVSYMLATGVSLDRTRAYALLTIGHDVGPDKADRFLRDLTAKMTPEELAAAKSLTLVEIIPEVDRTKLHARVVPAGTPETDLEGGFHMKYPKIVPAE